MDTAAQKAANRLLEVYRTREPIDPLTPEHPNASIELAYRIQQLQVEQWTLAGDVVKGHKVGLASRAIQRQMGVNQPRFRACDREHVLSGAFADPGGQVFAAAHRAGDGVRTGPPADRAAR